MSDAPFSRRWYWLGFLASLALLAIAYFYFQRHMGLPPCPLCMLQRAALVGIALFCLMGMLFKPGKIIARVLAVGVSLSAIFGLAIAGRHVWLQHLPADQVPECGPDLAFMLEVFPLQQVITQVLQGSGECAEQQWVFLGLSMPEWMLAIFSVMTLVALRMVFTKERAYFSGSYGK